jgi:hypothetical protein
MGSVNLYGIKMGRKKKEENKLTSKKRRTNVKKYITINEGVADIL